MGGGGGGGVRYNVDIDTDNIVRSSDLRRVSYSSGDKYVVRKQLITTAKSDPDLFGSDAWYIEK